MNRTASTRLPSVLLATAAFAMSCPLHAANALTVLHTFTGADGQYPYGRLVQGSDGALYGTTSSGGATGQGNLYRLGADGSLSILHSFEGGWTNSGLVLLEDGNFYGTTQVGSACQDGSCTSTGGSVFRMAPDGTFTTLHVFDVHRGYPGPLAAGGDGLLYGLTLQGGPASQGSSGRGNAYAIATDGTYVALGNFHGVKGYAPYGALTEATDGNFYGTTSGGGLYNKGTVFRMTPDGTLTTLYSFRGGLDGSWPDGSLVQGDDGRFYGGTSRDGGGAGTVFAITADGELTTLHAFNGADGTGPIGSLVQGDDGYLYGVSLGGHQNTGTLFRLSTSGRLRTLHLFATQEDGSSPSSAPTFGSDGRLYGTTRLGGPIPAAGVGTVYAFDLDAPRIPELRLTKTCYAYDGTSVNCQNQRQRYLVRLDWASANVAYCRASGAWNGMRPTSGSYNFRPRQPGEFLYRIDCNGPNGRTSAQVILIVTD